MNQVASLSPSQGCFCSNCTGFRGPKRSSRKRTVKRRKRKSSDQLRTLQVEFDKTADWGKDLVSYLAHLTGLSEAQVYKWGWDQKKKQLGRDRPEDPWDPALADLFAPLPACFALVRPGVGPEAGPALCPCVETILPSSLDAELYQVQRAYK